MICIRFQNSQDFGLIFLLQFYFHFLIVYFYSQGNSFPISVFFFLSPPPNIPFKATNIKILWIISVYSKIFRLNNWRQSVFFARRWLLTQITSFKKLCPIYDNKKVLNTSDLGFIYELKIHSDRTNPDILPGIIKLSSILLFFFCRSSWLKFSSIIFNLSISFIKIFHIITPLR